MVVKMVLFKIVFVLVYEMVGIYYEMNVFKVMIDFEICFVCFIKDCGFWWYFFDFMI